MDTKVCSNCWCQIKKLAVKCKHCHSWLNNFNNEEDHIHIPEDTNYQRELDLEMILLKISCVILGIAVIWVGWYGYYMLSRLAIFLIMLYLFIKNYKYKAKKEKKLWLYWITGLVYNPLLSITLTSFLWIIVDIAVIILFYKTIKLNKKNNNPL